MARRLFVFLLLPGLSFLAPHLLAAAPVGISPNIILVTLGSTRTNRVPVPGAKHATPNLDMLARQGISFEHAYAQAPLTVVSHAGILTGTYPQTHHASELGAALSPTVPYLPELLHTRGYRTAAFVGSAVLDPNGGFAPGFDRGFASYDAGFPPPVSIDFHSTLGTRSAAEVETRAATWLSHATGPFFLWINLDDPSTARNTFAYNHALAAVDGALGRLIATLQQLHLYDNVAIIVCADHGQSLGAHGEVEHGALLYDDTTHVPLLLKLPHNAMAGTLVPGRVRLLDIAPTILEITSLPVPAQMQGQSLLRIAKNHPLADQPVYARTDFPTKAFGWSALESWRAGKYLYIRAPHPELYDLAADPEATRNLAQRSTATLDTMAAQLADFDRHFQSTGAESKESRLTSTDMQRLASLGYVGLQKTAQAAQPALSGTDPKDAIATANKTLQAWSSLRQGNPKSAAVAFEQITSSQPKNFLAQWGLGASLSSAQRFNEAIGPLRVAIELQPHVAWVHYEMALCLSATGNDRAAAIHLEIASHLMPGSIELHAKLAEIDQRHAANRERTAAGIHR